MDEKLEAELVKRYPELYKDYGGDMRQTCMHWGFSHGDGWFHIIDNLSAELVRLGKQYNLKVVADQVKEKFGSLRFYYHVEGKISWYQLRSAWFQTLVFKVLSPKTYWKIIDFRKHIWRSPHEKISDAVEYAEELSYKTCERCSQPGKRTGGGWVSVLCEECAKDK